MVELQIIKYHQILFGTNMETTITLNAQQIEFIIDNFKTQLNMAEEEKLPLSGTSQSIMNSIINKLEE